MQAALKEVQVEEISMDFSGMSTQEIETMMARAQAAADDQLAIVDECRRVLQRLKGA